MNSQLASFCADFDGLVRPLVTPFGEALQALENAAPGTPGRDLRPALLELRHHLEVLCDKVNHQQAYVLIFGPLKSGKSTLMNAVAAAYVSEVSSLPAYPCLVFVQGGARREYVVTRYDGQQQTFLDAGALQEHITAAHGELAQAIRTAEGMNQVFDPPEHFPQAIRRVDVRVPAGALKESGAVLVDTPGLYTRMRFGYDRMTKDFRDAAACAVFVVKSDTLFLEQVFSEFNQLLELFSRIFLVVNVDTGKRDLGPDGALRPSLEQSNPDAILAAFTELAMSAPLQRAHAEGRVQIHAVDLMQAASRVLQGQAGEPLPESFVRFRTDLHDYLASNEYLVAFLRDSLQRARGLLLETRHACRGDDAALLRRAVAQTESALGDVRALQDRLRAALQLDLVQAFARIEQQQAQEAERSARDEGAKLLRTLGASIDTWFLSSHSLHWLLGSQWAPLVRDYRQDVQTAVRRVFEQGLAQGDCGLDLPRAVQDLCHVFAIDLAALRRQALQALGEVRWQGPESVPVDPEQIPLKKGVLDVLTFRSTDRVRERVFGPGDHPERKVPAKEKAARLGEPGRLFLHQKVGEFRTALAPATAASLQQHFGERLRQLTVERLLAALRAQEPGLQAEAERLARELARLRAALQPLDLLQQLCTAAEPRLQQLGQTYGAPLPPDEPVSVLRPARHRAGPSRTEGDAAGEPTRRARH